MGKKPAKTKKPSLPAMPADDKAERNVHYMEATDGKSKEQLFAEDMVRGDSWNGITAMNFSNASYGSELSVSHCIRALKSQIKQVQDGDLSQVEGMLFGQAISLSTIFHECARRSALNMGQQPEAMERYMRLALKAQSQCRTTLEALVEAKHPKSVSFVKQANIAGGHQQVNNGVRAGEDGNPPNELQEATYVGTVATRQTPQSIGTDARPEAVAQVHRTKNARGKGKV